PKPEQWIKGETKITTKADGEKTVPAYQRKRLRYFPGAVQAKKWYRTRQTPTPDPSAEFAALNQAFPLTASYNLLDRQGNQHVVKITLSDTALAHMCQRHCYTYFTWAKGDIKLVNNFWPRSKVVDVGQYFEIVSGALKDISQAGLDHILAEFEEDEQTRGGTITVVNVPHGRETLFFMAKFAKNPETSDEEDSVGDASVEDPSGDGEITTWALDLSTVAPDGTSAESYPTKELTDAKIP
nr:hypothetical protein [Micromonospora sp. DSM 115978]